MACKKCGGSGFITASKERINRLYKRSSAQPPFPSEYAIYSGFNSMVSDDELKRWRALPNSCTVPCPECRGMDNLREAHKFGKGTSGGNF